MQVLREDGIYRHFRFSKPNDSVHWFELVTWPGVLTINGDMGTYSFSRVDDMFAWFRSDVIDAGYRAGKCLAVDRHSPLREWCRVESRKQLAACVESWPTEARNEAFDLLNPESFDGEHEFRAAIEYFEVDHNGETFRIDDFWECDLTRDSYHFVWCLRAIAWGIQQFDARATAGGAL